MVVIVVLVVLVSRALVVLGLVASACTGSSGSTATTPPTDSATISVAAQTSTTTVPSGLDGCELITQADAEALFQQAVSMPADQVGGFPGQLGACIWQAEGGALLTISVFEGQEFFGAVGQLEGSEPIDLGDGGDIFVENEFLGVQMQWLQDGRTVTLNGDTLGIEDTSTFETDMMALAETVEGRLP